jgi:hypothetical protein
MCMGHCPPLPNSTRTQQRWGRVGRCQGEGRKREEDGREGEERGGKGEKGREVEKVDEGCNKVEKGIV